MFHVEHIILWWGVGIIHYLPHRHTFILYNISHPLPDLRLYPTPEIYSVLHPSPFHFISHSITFSYTISTISITISYILVGCEVVCGVIAQQIRVYINYNTLVLLHVYYIPLPPDRVSIVFY